MIIKHSRCSNQIMFTAMSIDTSTHVNLLDIWRFSSNIQSLNFRH